LDFFQTLLLDLFCMVKGICNRKLCGRGVPECRPHPAVDHRQEQDIRKFFDGMYLSEKTTIVKGDA